MSPDLSSACCRLLWLKAKLPAGRRSYHRVFMYSPSPLSPRDLQTSSHSASLALVMARSRLAWHCVQLLSVGHLCLALAEGDAEAVRRKTGSCRLVRSTEYRLRSTRSPSFRLGSGAAVANQQDTTEDTSVYCAGTTEAILPRLDQPPVTFADPELYKLYLP